MIQCDKKVEHKLLDAAGHRFCWSCGKDLRWDDSEPENETPKRKVVAFTNFWRNKNKSPNQSHFTLFTMWADHSLFRQWGITICGFCFYIYEI